MEIRSLTDLYCLLKTTRLGRQLIVGWLVIVFGLWVSGLTLAVLAWG